jgi:hypothetical protein
MGFQTPDSTCEQREAGEVSDWGQSEVPVLGESSHKSHTSGKRTDVRHGFEMCVEGHVDLSRR